MHIPQQFQCFPQPTLVLIGDHRSSSLYLAGGDAMEELEIFSFDTEWKTDHESSFVNTDTGRVHTPEIEHEEEKRHYLQDMAAGITHYFRIGAGKKITLVLPLNLLNGLKKQLPRTFLPYITHQIAGDFRKHLLIKVLKRISEKPPTIHIITS